MSNTLRNVPPPTDRRSTSEGSGDVAMVTADCFGLHFYESLRLFVIRDASLKEIGPPLPSAVPALMYMESVGS